MWRGIRRDKQIDFRRLAGVPVLLLWAEKDRLLPFPGRALRLLQRSLPQARTEHIPLSGHLLLEEQPAASSRALRRFLQGEGVPERVATEADAPVV
jgi:pimeloyl-ACP methyl ester carboxylesterase